jgi:hypothetical protein
MSYRLATTDTEAPGARVASTIRCFRSAVHLRRSERPIAHHRASTLVSTNPLGGHHHAKTRASTGLRCHERAAQTGTRDGHTRR